MIGITADFPVRDTPLITFSASSENVHRCGSNVCRARHRTISLMLETHQTCSRKVT